MTNLYKLSHKQFPKLIFIHGLNNHARAFEAIRKHFTEIGFETEQVILPGHGEHREEALDFESAYKIFSERFSPLVRNPYVVIGFSTGAMYLQIWKSKNPTTLPLAQVLLAPALALNFQGLVSKLINILPDKFFIKSFSPQEFRRYETMYIWEYRILLKGIKECERLDLLLKIPTLILIDPNDELVSAKKLQLIPGLKNNSLLVLKEWPRTYLKKCLGQHHILFHPDYFTPEDWKAFTNEIENFINKNTAKISFEV